MFKESKYWIRLNEPRDDQTVEQNKLIKEALELTKIFGSIFEKCK